MANDHLLIAANNYADEGEFTWYAGWWLDELPLVNAQDRRLGKKARTAGLDPAGTNFTIDLGKLRTIGLVAVLAHNLSGNSKWRVLLSSDGANWHDSGEMPIWPRVEEFGTLPWGVFNWGGIIAADVEQKGYAVHNYYLPTPVRLARFVRIYLIDDGNPDGFLEFGRLYIGPIWQPSVNAQYPLGFSYEDPTRVTYSRGGQAYFDEQQRRRILRFRLAFIPEDEIMSQVFEALDRLRGVAGDVIVIPNPVDLRNMHRQAVYGRVRVLGENSMTFFNQYSREFEVEELL